MNVRLQLVEAINNGQTSTFIEAVFGANSADGTNYPTSGFAPKKNDYVKRHVESENATHTVKFNCPHVNDPRFTVLAQPSASECNELSEFIVVQAFPRRTFNHVDVSTLRGGNDERQCQRVHWAKELAIGTCP